MQKSEGYFLLLPSICLSSKNTLHFLCIIHFSYGIVSDCICRIRPLSYGIFLYHFHTANGTILNVTSESDLFLNILVEHILDTPTQHNRNPMQPSLYIFSNNRSLKWWNCMLNETTLCLNTGTVPVDSGRSFVKACYCIGKASMHELSMFLNHYSTENSKQIFNKSLQDTFAT